MTIKTRFAPSPTGYLHIGGVRTALFCYLYAKKHAGRFVLRVEDTDRERSTEESVQLILEGMQWLGLDCDEGPFYQTDNFPKYKAVVAELLEAGHAYYCYCSKERLENLREEQRANKLNPRYDGLCRYSPNPEIEGVSPVVRFKNPEEGEVVFNDLVKGEIKVSNKELDDLIIARSDGTPTYNLTVVVDDRDMQISHVIRGDDHLNNTPRQINIYKALGAKLPLFAHLPMILGADGARLSKRHGAVNVLAYRDEGYFPEAVLNYLVRLGWSHGDQEIFSMQDMIDLFDISDVNRAASTFNPEKLAWINQEYIKVRTPESLAEDLMAKYGYDNLVNEGKPNLINAVSLYQDRVTTLKELADVLEIFYQDVVRYDETSVKKFWKEATPAIVSNVRAKLMELDDWTTEKLSQVIKSVVSEQEVGFAKVAQPLRIALLGSTNAPSIDALLALCGKSLCLERIDKALETIRL